MSTSTQNSKETDAALMKRQAHAVEAYLAEIVAQRRMPENLRKATEHGLLGGGKRMRPILTLRSCAAVGGQPEQAMPAAAAIELIHCFSLVHDDLPAMDNDELRRGRPTVWKAYGDDMAVLVGDLMSGLAFEVVAARLPAELAGRITLELALSTNDMIAGQVWDTLPDFPESMPPMDRLETIHQNKTGALIRCSCRMGAICGGASEAQLAGLTRYGEAIGLMFQVVDDLLDITQTSEHLGKTAGKDVDQGKLTYPALIGVDASRKVVEQLHAEAYDSLKAMGDNAQPLRDLCDFLATRTN